MRHVIRLMIKMLLVILTALAFIWTSKGIGFETVAIAMLSLILVNLKFDKE